MTYLIDTHVLLWMATAKRNLSASANAALGDRRNKILLSAAGIWELAIKHNRGRLKFADGFGGFLSKQIDANDIDVLPTNREHLIAFEKLTALHGDPFDRMIVAQAIHERIPVISKDALLSQYPIDVIW